MKQAVNYMRGSIRVKVECPYPERFVNVCAQNGVEFWRLRRESETVITVSLHISGYRRLRTLADRAGFLIQTVKSTGIPFFVRRVRKRYILLIGMALTLLMVQAMSLFVCEIEVRGNDKVPSELILETLEELNVGIGSFGPSVTTEAVSNEMLLRIPELSWIAVNVRGSRAEVLVRERIPKPELIDKNVPVMITASKTGLIIKASVLEGRLLPKIGDTVQTGDILVSGIMESIRQEKRIVRAMAEIYARTWYEKSAQMPLETVIKEYTGESRRKTSLVIAGKKIKLFLSSGISWTYYDKMTEVRSVRLPTGGVLPIAGVVEKYNEYTPVCSALSVTDAEKILRDRLLEELYAEIGDGEVVSGRFDTTVSGGIVTVTLKAECIEQIAAERDFTEEELRDAGYNP